MALPLRGEALTIQEQSAPFSSAAYRSGERSRSEHDRELVLLHLQGDPDAFSIIVENHYRELAARARSLLGPAGEPEDAVQETFLRALRGIRQFGLTGEYRLGAWLNTILSNVCSDQRNRSVKDRLLAHNAGREPHDQSDVADQVSDPQTLDSIRSAILSLPPMLRRAFIHHELDQVPYSVLAEIEDSSVELARTRVHRAKTSLRQSLAGIESVAGALISVPFLRSVRARLATVAGSREKSRLDALGAGQRLNGVTLAPARLGRGAQPTFFGRVATQVAGTPLGQSAMAMVSSAPRGAFMFGIAATVATLSASTVAFVGTGSATSGPAPSANMTLAADQTPAPLAIGVPPAASPTDATAATGGPSYSWVNAGGDGAPSGLAAASCVPSNGVTPPGAGANLGTPLGLANALAVADTPAVALSTVGPSFAFSANAPVDPFGSGTATGTASVASNVCLSSTGAWFTATVSGLGDQQIQLVGTLQGVIGSGGDVAYVFRGTVTPSPSAGPVAGAVQFAAEVTVLEPDNSAQLTLVFLSAEPQTPSPDPSAGTGPVSGGVSTSPPPESSGTPSIGSNPITSPATSPSFPGMGAPSTSGEVWNPPSYGNPVVGGSVGGQDGGSGVSTPGGATPGIGTGIGAFGPPTVL